MDNEEVNSAEMEAEQILKAEYMKARAEECRQGEECAVHFRVDEAYLEESARYARLITYLGNFCVLTEDNHALDNPVIMLKILLGRIRKEDLPPRYETTVFYVGSGALGDLEDLDLAGRLAARRYAVGHDHWELVELQHEDIVAQVKADKIDLSKPYPLEG